MLPTTRKHQPNDIAQNSKRSGAYVFAPEILRTRHCLLAKREQCIGSDVECRPRPWQTDNGDRHKNCGDNPAQCHPGAKLAHASKSKARDKEPPRSAKLAGAVKGEARDKVSVAALSRRLRLQPQLDQAANCLRP